MKYNYEDFIKNLGEDFNGLLLKEETVRDNLISIFHYIIQYNELFANDIIKEMRGITFVNKKDYFLSLHKFFNIDQHPDTLYEDLKNKKIVEITDKLDGSLINPIWIDDVLYMKSKASITSEQSVKATEFVNNNEIYYTFVLDMYKKGLHPIFEYISPTNRIVLEYDKDDLVLLQVRDDTGNYINIKDIHIPNGISIRAEYDLTKFPDLDSIYNYIRTSEDLEGVVIKFDDNQMVKLKSEWYFNKHSYTCLTEKDYMSHILNDTIDDILSLSEFVDVEYIKKCMKKVRSHITWIVAYVIEYDYDYATRKEFAVENNTDMFFSYLIRYYENRNSKEIVDCIKEDMKKKYNKLSTCCEFFNE